MTIAERLFDTLKSKGIQQKELADALNIRASTINNWKSRNSSIPSEHIIPICDFLSIDIYWLLSGEGEIIEKISSEQKELLQNWDKLTERAKGRVEQLISMLLGSPDTKNMKSEMKSAN